MGADAVAYKAAVIDELQRMGHVMAYAYGNSASDVGAYRQAGIPDPQIFVVGAGASDFEGTGAIPDGQAFTQHVVDHVQGALPACE